MSVIDGMKNYLRLLTGGAAGAAALLFSSCAYDPYYTSVGGSYSTGYSSGHGGGYSSSIFVSTGNPQWGYDPHCHSYYDYYRGAYYDPYLYGYYPVGYRPAVIVGVPHPYGYRSGSRYCSPPRRVNNVTILNYRERDRLYRNSDYGWARQTRLREPGRDNYRPDRSENRGDSRTRSSPQVPRQESRSEYRRENSPQTSRESGDRGSSRYASSQMERERAVRSQAGRNSDDRRASQAVAPGRVRAEGRPSDQEMRSRPAQRMERQRGEERRAAPREGENPKGRRLRELGDA